MLMNRSTTMWQTCMCESRLFVHRKILPMKIELKVNSVRLNFHITSLAPYFLEKDEIRHFDVSVVHTSYLWTICKICDIFYLLPNLFCRCLMKITSWYRPSWIIRRKGSHRSACSKWLVSLNVDTVICGHNYSVSICVVIVIPLSMSKITKCCIRIVFYRNDLQLPDFLLY
jgi:hypothetical protein